jgi:hypothetical protein
MRGVEIIKNSMEFNIEICFGDFWWLEDGHNISIIVRKSERRMKREHWTLSGSRNTLKTPQQLVFSSSHPSKCSPGEMLLNFCCGLSCI